MDMRKYIFVFFNLRYYGCLVSCRKLFLIDIERGNPGVHVETNALVSHQRSDSSPCNSNRHGK